MKINTLLTMGLVFGFSTSSIFAENPVLNVENDSKPYFDRLNQIQRNGVSTKLSLLDEILDAKSEIERLRAKNIPRNPPRRDQRPKKDSLPVTTKPRESAASNVDRLKKNGKLKSTFFPTATERIKGKFFSGKKLTVAEVRQVFYPDRSNKQLTSIERKELLQAYNFLLKKKVTLAFLRAIMRAEGSPSPKTVVGWIQNGGYKYTKTRDCQKRISKLTLKSHAKEQGLPQPCFIRTSAGPSSAFGWSQIVNRTWQQVKNRLKFKDFSRHVQAQATLDLMRRSNPEAFAALINSDLDTAIKKGTSEWASGYSKLNKSGKTKILTYAHQEHKKLYDKEYYQQWVNEVFDDSTF